MAIIDHRTIHFPEFLTTDSVVSNHVDPDIYHHQMGGVSKGDLDALAKSFAHFRYRREHPPDPTPALQFGSMFHTMLLEPTEWEARHAVPDEGTAQVDRRTKVGKEIWANWIASIGSRKPVDRDDYLAAQEMVRSIRDHPLAGRLFTDGVAEKTVRWNQNGIVGKCRPDWISSSGLVVDVKTAISASAADFTRVVVNFRYYVQAAWYLQGLEVAGLKDLDWVFVVVEKDPPYAVAVYALDNTFLEHGKLAWEDGLNKLWLCYDQMDRGELIEGYGDAVVRLTCPPWA